MNDLSGMVLWAALALAYVLSVRLLHRQSQFALPMALSVTAFANVVPISKARRMRVERLGAA